MGRKPMFTEAEALAHLEEEGISIADVLEYEVRTEDVRGLWESLVQEQVNDLIRIIWQQAATSFLNAKYAPNPDTYPDPVTAFVDAAEFAHDTLVDAVHNFTQKKLDDAKVLDNATNDIGLDEAIEMLANARSENE
jgi:hypothetical protein